MHAKKYWLSPVAFLCATNSAQKDADYTLLWSFEWYIIGSWTIKNPESDIFAIKFDEFMTPTKKLTLTPFSIG